MAKGFTMRRPAGVWMIRTYVVGQTAEKVKFRIPETICRNREKVRREVRRQEKKMTNGLRGIARVVNASFYRTDGYLLELTYADEQLERLAQGMPEGLNEESARDYIRDAAQHQMELWMRRVRRACAAEGIEFRYWGITSDVDKDGEACRVHHHVIVSPEALGLCRMKWTAGGVRDDRLWDEPDHNDLVAYLLRQVRAGRDEKRYTPSRNLKKPEMRERTVHSDAELSIPRGARLIHRDEMTPGAPQYIRYVLPGWGDEDAEGVGQMGHGEGARGRAREPDTARGRA